MEYLTVPEAAETLGVSDGAIRKRIRTGRMRADRAGVRVLLIPKEEVERWRAIGKVRPGPKATLEAAPKRPRGRPRKGG